MAIKIVNENIFVVETKNTHYVLGIDEKGYNIHIHWGAKCADEDYEISEIWHENSHVTELDMAQQEYTVFGGIMYRESDLKATYSDSCRETELKVVEANVTDDVLALVLRDKTYPLEITLKYTASEDDDIITRWAEIKNVGTEDVVLDRVFSAGFTLPSKYPYKFLNTNGAWCAEGVECENELTGGSLTFESKRGISGHNNSPYFIAHQGADELNGNVYFAILAYSGNFKVISSRDVFHTTRVNMGISDHDFKYILKGGEIFVTPKVFCGCTNGFGEMSRQLSKFGVKNVLPKPFNDKILPVLYNSWEATEFDVSTEGQSNLAKKAADLGCELFVMDDGWFGARNDDHAGLGDWFVSEKKFPNGLDELIKNVNDLGMDFGIWFEPEMVNPNSDLFRAHPEWAYHYDTRTAHELRNQLVLNMTRKDVQEYIFERLDDMLSNHNVKYIKWDMNRSFSETGAENLDCPQELWYLHTQAVYSIVDALKEKHPDVVIESCSSGGGRTDWGALSHFDQTWPSDNTDGVDRMSIQKSYSMTRPIKTMRAWVTDVNWYNKPVTLDFRFNIAMQGALGIGGNLLKYSDEDLALCKEKIALYKEIRHLVQFGNLYRILDFDRDEILFNLYVSDDKTEAVGFVAAPGTRFMRKSVPFCFQGLDDSIVYEVEFDGKTYKKSGAYLKNVGISKHVRGANYNKIIRIKKA